jgi:hypothetical protein
MADVAPFDLDVMLASRGITPAFHRSKAASFASRAARRAVRTPATTIDDLLSTQPVGIYGFKKLRTAYAGQCCRVRRTTDNAQRDIPFLSDGVVNTALMKAFRSTGDLYLVTLYDQSANAYDATQATAGSQPFLDLEYLRAGCPSSVGGLLVASGLQLTSTANAAVWTVVSNYSARLSQRLFECGTNGQFSFGLTPDTAFGAQPYVGGSSLNFGNPNMATVPACNGSVVGINSAAGGMTLYSNDGVFTRAAASVVNPAAGFSIGSSVGYGCDLQASVVFNAALSTADAALLQAILSEQFTCVFKRRSNLMMIGDSMTASSVVGNFNYNKVLLDFIPEDVAVMNVGQGGQTAQGMASDATNRSTPFFRSGMRNVAAMLGGRNDIIGGRTALQLQGDVTGWANGVRTAGWLPMAATLYPVQITGAFTAPMEIERVAYNTWLRANSGPGKIFEDIVDFELETALLPKVASVDFPDNIHPSLEGYRKVTPVLADAFYRQMYA